MFEGIAVKGPFSFVSEYMQAYVNSSSTGNPSFNYWQLGGSGLLPWKTQPKLFIQDHYPDDIKWTLLDDPPTLAEFSRSPFKQPSFNYKILSYSPSRGIINATIGDTITIALETSDTKKNLCLLDKPSVDSADIVFADSCLKTNKTSIIKGDKVSANYIVTNYEAQWLQVIYNSNIILRYKLNIKKQPFVYPPVIIKDIAVNN